MANKLKDSKMTFMVESLGAAGLSACLLDGKQRHPVAFLHPLLSEVVGVAELFADFIAAAAKLRVTQEGGKNVTTSVSRVEETN